MCSCERVNWGMRPHCSISPGGCYVLGRTGLDRDFPYICVWVHTSYITTKTGSYSKRRHHVCTSYSRPVRIRDASISVPSVESYGVALPRLASDDLRNQNCPLGY